MLYSHKCLCCKKKYLVKKYRNKRTKYCSRICQCKSISNNKGRKRPDLTKRNLDNNPTKRGAKSFFWKGGRNHDADGYIRILKTDHPNASVNGYVLEHRLKIEKKIGRYLKKEEIIHHKNGKRDDNRLSNLVLMSKIDHDRYHTKLRHKLKQFPVYK